jgi:phage terminase large subunit
LEESSENNPYYNKTDHIYRRPGWNGVFQFFGADDSGKVRGPRRHILFMNEGNNIPWETARGLDSRTEIFTIVDWNPVSEFWAHDYWIGSSENAYDHSTYEDALESGVVSPQLIKDNVEIYRDKDPNWWRIYGQGLIGKIENLVHPYFEQVDALPEGFTVYGLDWGFASDPTVLVKNVIIGDKLYSRQLLWDKSGLTNDQIAREMELLLIGPNDPIYADPNEPKSIAEIKQKRFNIMEAVKGPGSVAFGIQRVNQFYQYWTKDSVECIKEQRNFRYIKRMVQGREELTDDTTHQWSHGMSARRYAVASFRQNVGNKPKSKHGVAI